MADDPKPRIGTPLQAIRFFQEFIETSSSQDWFRAWDDGVIIISMTELKPVAGASTSLSGPRVGSAAAKKETADG